MDQGFEKVAIQFNRDSGEIRDLNGSHVIFIMAGSYHFSNVAEPPDKDVPAQVVKDNVVEKLTAIKALGYKLPDVIKLKEAGVI